MTVAASAFPEPKRVSPLGAGASRPSQDRIAYIRRRLADVVLPPRLGHLAVSLREVDGGW